MPASQRDYQHCSMPGVDSERSDNLPSCTLRDEISALVAKACASGIVTLAAVQVLWCTYKGRDHPYLRAARLAPYQINALTRDCGEKLFSDDGSDANVWEWAHKKKRMKGLQNLFMEAGNVGADRDARVLTFLHRLLASELPPQSCVQESAALVIASRFIAYPETGAIVMERTTMGDQAVYSSNTEHLACILAYLRAACTGGSIQDEEESTSLWNKAVGLAGRLQDPVVAPFTSHAFGLFNGLICAVAKSVVSFVLCPESLASHCAKLVQVVPEDVERVAGNVLHLVAAKAFGEPSLNILE
jgi:hypothetical protein